MGQVFHIYPNPTSGNFIIDCQISTGNAEARVFDSLGKLIYSGFCLNGTNEITLKVDAGVYVLQLKLNGILVSKKLVVLH